MGALLNKGDERDFISPSMDLRLPPTPPDNDKHQQRGYATPLNASNPLTPDGTPPPPAARMLRLPEPEALSRNTSSIAESFRTAVEGSAASTPDIHHAIQKDAARLSPSQAEDDLDRHINYIPVEHIATTTHLQGNNHLSPAPLLPPHPLPTSMLQSADGSLHVRKKRKQSPRRLALHHTPRSLAKAPTQESGDWNDIPPGMIVNDHLYKQIQRENMDRLEAIQDGTAIEAVVLATDTGRKPSLRHVKKRHSLRIGSEGDAMHASSPQSARTEMPDREPAQDRRVASLKHKKVNDHQEHEVDAPASISALSAGSNRTLRHERRPLSAGGRPQRSVTSPTLPSVPAAGFRHSSLPTHLAKDQAPSEAHGLRRASKESRLENITKSDDHTTGLPLFEHESTPLFTPGIAGLSPSIKSHRFANTQTPMSVISDRTEMELCEAKNVTLFTHSNDSVLLINHGTPAVKKPYAPQQIAQQPFQPLGFTFENPESPNSTSCDSLTRSLSTPEIQVNGNSEALYSPLINPRAAPLPPTIQFIPPTPSNDDDREVEAGTNRPDLQRRGSLMKTARRLSDSLLTPLFARSSPASKPQVPSTTTGNDRLHPMWTPNHMYDEDDDDDDYSTDDDEYNDDYENRLPRGGDTSAHPVQPRSLFPRQMSVRMPGFRGTGGFLLGNSPGVERHGTNKRRHHVDLQAKRQRNHRPSFLDAMKRRVRSLRAAREESALEKWRTDLKNSIGPSVVLKEIPLTIDRTSEVRDAMPLTKAQNGRHDE